MSEDAAGSHDSGSDDALDSLDTGLDALALVDVVRELFEAVDFEALQNGVAYEEAVDEAQLHEALGGPVGKVVARRLADRVVGGGVTGLVGREIAGRVGASLVEYLVETVDPETIVTSLQELTNEQAGTVVDEEPTTIDIDTPDDEE
ncbi:hypothetical protein ACFPYI_12680 [Halomarina salina]|uniref:Uncharacterized protein n=1 Tax=Halomarina salina TaxID=1872699 RepID=A0ABD5RP20_9EURY|nr:hypothetical protein [Halomarina salina]